ncbi:MAG: YkgJ family cysteine cluster protein [Phycisphaerales bacterium]|nr:MAG: YkgJ family cysteine cluster protein [Phycisphaerales bacterium]
MKKLEAAGRPKNGATIVRIGTSDTYHRDSDIIGLEIEIVGKELEFCITAGKDRITLADIVPLSRILSAEITAAVLENIHAGGDYVPCTKGCSACCGPYLVPLSVPEAFRLHQDVAVTKRHYRDLFWRGCLHATRRILDSVSRERPPLNATDLKLIAGWYRSLRLTCPFLCNHECLIYEQRPLACREYFVKGSAGVCRGQPDTAEVVKLPVQMPNVLAQLSSELEETSTEAMMLPVALVWCEENADRAAQTWPGAMMVERFVEIVRAAVSKKPSAIAEQGGAIIGISRMRRQANRLCRSLSG